jgi:thiamine pyrophosphokinase
LRIEKRFDILPPQTTILNKKQQTTMKAIIIAGGMPPTLELLEKEITLDSIIICADSGANFLYKFRILPNYIIGDLDSISKKALLYFKKYKVLFETYPQDKNQTDAELAVKKAKELNATEVVLLGCLGGKRIDHQFGALGLLTFCKTLGLESCLKDPTNTITLIDKSTNISATKGARFSLLAYCDVVKKLSIRGSKFELTNYNLQLGDTRTISNEFLDNDVTITFESGRLLLVRIED